MNGLRLYLQPRRALRTKFRNSPSEVKVPVPHEFHGIGALHSQIHERLNTFYQLAESARYGTALRPLVPVVQTAEVRLRLLHCASSRDKEREKEMKKNETVKSGMTPSPVSLRLEYSSLRSWQALLGWAPAQTQVNPLLPDKLRDVAGRITRHTSRQPAVIFVIRRKS
jgi:hypothetical protein